MDDDEVVTHCMEQGLIEFKDLLEGELEIPKEDTLGIVEAMHTYGGNFVSSLGTALMSADADNRKRIKLAWPEYWAQYENLGKKIKERGGP